MAKVYSTPGVYIEEKSAFPNSVVAVATAVPAFIGYTQKAIRNKRRVTNEPIRISSFGEFLLYFGDAPKTTFSIASTDLEPGFKLSPKEEYFLLFNSIKLFYSNGGADCYIVSIGSYTDTVKADDFFGLTSDNKYKGIDALLKYMEPSILVAPDVMLLNPEEASKVQRHMLKHCGTDTKSRFAILDVPNGDKKQKADGESVIETFRKGITNNRDFGAAYYPWLHTTITSKSNINFERIHIDDLEELQKILQQNIAASLKAGTVDQKRADDIKAEIDKIKDFKPYLILEQIQSRLQDLYASEIAHLATLNTSTSSDDDKTKVTKKVKQIIDDIQRVVNIIQDLSGNLDKLLSNSSTSSSSTEEEKNKQTLIKTFGEFKSTLSQFRAKAISDDFSGIDTEYDTLKAKITDCIKLQPSIKSLDKALLAVHPLYKNIIEDITEWINLLPPSGAMAGIYTMIDNHIGVFQSPANVSVGSVVKPAVDISSNEQENLNVPLEGKAVNAIRTFPHKGVLVWGARTLDGNSLDWRYISVRRTVIMIEQSVKNAAEAYVFEPNVASTWSNVKAMLTNFLTNVWASGALAGATPEDAFSVDVGLGVTMTPVDILEGIMRISIKLAITRPAEFIVITFEQQMQKS